MLIADNAKWDSAGKMEAILEDYLHILNDPKPITVRQCIQGLSRIALYKPDLGPKIADRLVAFDLAGQRETMRKSILLDIVNTLMVIRSNSTSDTIEAFIQDALSGDILDKKAKRQIEAQMGTHGDRGRNTITDYVTALDGPYTEVKGFGLKSRYVTEDVPYLVVAGLSLAEAAGVPAPTMELCVQLASAIMDVDYRSAGYSLARLGLDGLDRDGILATVRER